MPSTPIPPVVNQVLDKVQNTVDSAVQQGVVGVLLLIAIAIALFALGYAIKQWSKRNSQEESLNTGTNDAIAALARMTDKMSEQSRIEREEQRKTEAEYRGLIKDMNERHIESIAAIADANNRLADNLMNQTGLLSAINNADQAQSVSVNDMSQSLKQMTEYGSKPLQGLIETADHIKKSIDELTEQIKKILDDKAACASVEEIVQKMRNELLDYINQQTIRATGTTATVTVPEQELNVIPDSGAGEAAA